METSTGRFVLGFTCVLCGESQSIDDRTVINRSQNICDKCLALIRTNCRIKTTKELSEKLFENLKPR